MTDRPHDATAKRAHKEAVVPFSLGEDRIKLSGKKSSREEEKGKTKGRRRGEGKKGREDGRKGREWMEKGKGQNDGISNGEGGEWGKTFFFR